ncbi:MAG: tRNA lysidine(34) synthetase TilS [Dehalococcoidia bacterium]|nr:tRNA lysidine(34) synthetase TilS [Dehalococcoidia bacterium]
MKIDQQLSRQVRRFIDDHQLIEAPGPLVVGVSGGADSVCLLHILAQLQDELGLNLHVAHLNHRLRGEESDGDARYVAELAQKLALSVIIEERDVSSYQVEKRISLEEAAREVRYAFFSRVAKSVGADAVAVGHTADDQAETILMHLIRGTGMAGLRGMQPLFRRHLPGGSLRVIRPLLEVTRQQTEAYCSQCNLSPRIDSSNLSPKYLRNRIRSELMPILQGYNSNIRENLTRTARIVVADMDQIDATVSQLWESVASERPDGIALDNKAFAGLSLSLKRYLLRSVLEKLLGELRDIEEVHIESLLEAMEHPAGKKLFLPEGLLFWGDYTQSLITTEEEAPCPLPKFEGEHKLAVPGELLISGWGVKAQIRDWDSGCRVQESGVYRAVFDFDLTGADLTIRSRREGDRFQPLGMQESKKLQDFMTDAKIPRAWRDRVPLLCSWGQILWVVGWRIDDRAKVTPSTRRVLEIEFERD